MCVCVYCRHVVFCVLSFVVSNYDMRGACECLQLVAWCTLNANAASRQWIFTSLSFFRVRSIILLALQFCMYSLNDLDSTLERMNDASADILSMCLYQSRVDRRYKTCFVADDKNSLWDLIRHRVDEAIYVYVHKHP